MLVKILYALLVVVVGVSGLMIGGYMFSEHSVQVVPTDKVVVKDVVKEVPVYHNTTIVKEVPVEKVIYKNNTIVEKVDKLVELRESFIDYVESNFADDDECVGFNLSNFDETEISLYDVDDFSMKVESDDYGKFDYSDIKFVAEFKYKAEDLPREYHKFNVTINYDNDDREIVNCSMVQIS